ncbi:MAG: DUF1573 domain-containing protein [Candidatus Gygaella obscura]|nr:DUF1573 domain-containing protein [Candidatus Gygaella obscura]
MRKIIFFVLAIFLLPLICFAQPQIKISTDQFDLGRIEEGKLFSHEVIVRNAGTDRLDIKIRLTCDCVQVTEPSVLTFFLSPDEFKIIKFNFDSTGYSKDVIQYLILDTNDPENPSIRIPVKAFVVMKQSKQVDKFRKLNMTMVLGAGLADSINPCAFTVLVFFVSFLGFVGYRRKEIIFVGTIFIITVFLTYLLLGLGVFEIFKILGINVYLEITIALLTMGLAFLLAALNIYDFVIFKRTKDAHKTILKLPGMVKSRIQSVIKQSTDIREKTGYSKKTIFGMIISSVGCAFLVTVFESVCTGQLYLPTIVFVMNATSTKFLAFSYLVLYNLMFVLPLFIIVILGGYGLTSEKFARFSQKNLGLIKIITALIFLTLGGILLLWKKEDFIYLFSLFV